MNHDESNLENIKHELEKIEKDLSNKIEFAANSRLFILLGVIVVIISLFLPHAGNMTGYFVITHFNTRSVAITSKVYLIFFIFAGIFTSAITLLTRRWVLSLISAAGCVLAFIFGILSIWARNTPDLNSLQPSKAGIGLYIGVLTMVFLSYNWIRLAWIRSDYLRAIEAERREVLKEESN